MDCVSNCSIAAGQEANQTFSLEINPGLLQLYNVYLYLMIVLGVLGNLVVLVVFSKLPPNTTTDWFILFITTCDFITSFVNVPIYVTFTNGVWKYFGNNIICTLHMFISQSLVLSSAFLICGLALDRYFKICKPMTSYSKTRAKNVCLLISLLATLLSLPCFVMWENRESRCQSVSMGYGLFLYYMFVFLTFILAIAVVVFSYTHVTKTVRESEDTIVRHNRSINIPRGINTIRTAKVNQVQPYSHAGRTDNVFGDRVQVNNFFTLEASNKTSHGTQLLYPTTSTASMDPVPSTSSKEVCIPSNFRVLFAPKAMIQRGSFNNENNSANSTIPGRAVNADHLATIRTTKIAFLVCTIFIVTWIPPWASFILYSIPGMQHNVTFVNFALFGRMTHLINTMTNPILYTWLNRKFRRKIIGIFLCRKI